MQALQVGRAWAPGTKSVSFFLRVWLLCAGLLWSSLASAAVSVTCPTINANVAHGGTVVIDVSTCDDPDDFGLGATVVPPSHGSISVSTVAPQTVTYSHHGNSATSDTFVINDGQSPEGEITFNITIAPPTSSIVVTPATLPAMTAGTAFSQGLASSGGTAPYTYSVSSGALPVGITLTTAGVISGTPTQRGAYSFNVRSQDANGDFVDKGYTGSVQNPTLSISPTSATALQGIAFSQTLTASGGVAPHAFALESGAFPAGISISASGVVSGTTGAAPGNYPVTLRVTDSSTGPGSYFELEGFTLTVSPPPSVSIAVAPASVNEDGGTSLVYTVTRSLNLSSPTVVNITTSGTATSGSDYTGGAPTVTIPAGATTATITIDPTADSTVEANETVVLTVAAGSGYTVGAPASATGTIVNEDAISVEPATLPNATVGAAYSQTLTASGGSGAMSFSVTAGALPAGLTLSSTGTLSGTPTAGGIFNFTVTATDSSPAPGPYSGSRSYALTVGAPAISLAPATLPGAMTGTAYSQTITASGGTAPYSFVVTAGALPPGLTLASNGTLSGTPTAAGTFNFTVTATDSSTGTGPYTGSRAFSLVVTEAAPVANPVSATVAYGSNANPITLNITGGTPTSVAVATAPAHGTAIASGTSITYTPTVGYGGPDSFTYTASNSSGTSAPATVTITVSPPTITVSPPSLPDATVGAAYSQTLSASGGAAPYSFSLTAGALPPGLALASSGSLSGTPTAAGTYNFTVAATDSSTGDGPYTASRAYTLVVAAAAITISPTTLPNPTVGSAYSQTLTASGGTGPYSFSLLSGALPVGIVFSSAGVFSGTPTTAGTYTFTVRATDSFGNTGDQAYTLVISSPVIVISPSTLPDATVGVAYSQTFTASGGVGPYAFSLVSGALPIGMSMSSGGAFTGTPASAGTYNFTVRAADSLGYTGDRPYSLVVAAPVIVVSPAALPDATRGIAYSQTFTASGGTGPYSFSLVSGALPIGMSMSSSGVFSGTPASTGTYNFNVRATDSFGSTGDKAYSLVVNGAAPVANNVSATVDYGSGANPITLNITGGAATSVSVVSAPGNGTAIASGTSITYQPNAGFAGSDSFTYTATNGSGTSAPATVSVTVTDPAITITPAGGFSATVGVPYSQTFTWAGGAMPYSGFQVTGLPAGLSITATSSDSVTVSGTPAEAGSFTLDASATDSSTGNGPFTVGQAFTLNVAAPTITVAPATLPDGVRGTAYNASFSASGGVAPYSFAVSAGALPTGLSLSASGALTGTPTSAGSFDFTVTATDAASFTGSASYTVVIAEAAPVAVADAATTLSPQPVTVAVTANDTGAITSIAIAAAPAHGTAVVTGMAVVYTPAAGFSGTDTFTYTASGPGGMSAPATVTITVNPQPVAVSSSVDAAAGVPVAVDLTQGATGGPFTAATVVALTPASSGTATIAPSGSAYLLTYMPASGFAGVATVQFTLSNAHATSAPATITVNVAPRPDPSRDPEVRGLLDAQAESARRFADAQINNFQQRLENLHGSREGGRFSNGLNFQTSSRCLDAMGRKPGDTCNLVASVDGGGAGTPPVAGDRQGSDNGALGTWIGGMIRSGNHDGRGGGAGVDFESDGVSAGLDYRFSPAFALGGGLGFGRDESDIGEQGSRVEGDAVTLALYASYHPGETYFLDALLGYQRLSYDLRRFVVPADGLVRGSRDGTQWFGSVSTGAQIQRGAWRYTPYARLDMARAKLDGYTEQGEPLYALAYGEQDVDTTTGNVGMRFEFRRDTTWGAFAPQLRLEYQHDFQADSTATLQYADLLGGPLYRVDTDGFDRSRFMLGLGAMFYLPRDFSLRVEYRGLFGNEGSDDNAVMFNLEKGY